MKKLKLLLPLLMAIVMMAMSPTMAWAISGSGTSSSPYQISSASDWSTFRTAVNGRSSASTAVYAKLTGSFTISSGDYTPVGTSSKPFYGEFNGQGYTITLSNAQGSSDDFGLFGYVSNATIQNLKVAGTLTVTGTKKHIGGIVGVLQNASSIKGCTFSGTLDAGSSYDSNGGIVGFAKDGFSGSITNCFCNGTLKTTSTSGDRHIGGIVGYFNDESSKKPTIQYNFSDTQFKNGSSNMSSGTYINGIIGDIRAHADNIKYNTCIANGNVTRAMQSGNTNATIDSSNKAITISVTAGTGGSVSKSYVNPTSSAPTKVQATASPSSHYVFDKWTSSSSSSTSLSTSTSYLGGLTSSVSLYANFKRDSHTITATSANSNMGTVSGGGTYTHSTTAKITANAKTGYSFDYWMNGSTKSTTNPISFTVESDQTYTAYFKVNQYKITATTNNEKYGTVTGGGTYDYNKPVTLTATPATGYHFVSWSDGTKTYKAGDTNCATNANGVNTLSINVPASNTTYTATFAPNQYTITLKKYSDLAYRCKIYANGTESTGGTYDYGTKLTLKAVPDTYCYFSAWKNGDNTVSSTAEFTYEVKGDATLTAVCYKTEYTLTLQANNAAMGTVSGGGKCDAYTDATIKATANDLYHFVNWTKDGAEVSTKAEDTQYRAHGNETLVANFAIDQHTITAQANNDDWGTVVGSDTYDYNSQQTLTATPKQGYHFVSWNDGNTNASRQITVTGAATYTATFEAHDFTSQSITETYLASSATCTHAATYYYYCSRCGEMGTETYTSTEDKDKALGHDFTSQTTTEAYLVTPATCTEAATYYYKCSRCEEKGSEYYTSTEDKDKAKGHTVVTDRAVEATCTETGLTEGSHCSVCKAVIVAQESTPAKGHSTPVIDEAVEATCTETGLTEGSHCSVCNAVIVAQETIPTKAHSTVKVDAKAATCGDTGNIEHWKCTVCGKLFSDEACTTETTLAAVTIARAHNWSDDTHTYCTKCNRSFIYYTASEKVTPYTPASLSGYDDANNTYDSTTKQGEIELPSKLTSIGQNAFFECSGLQSITIPSSVTSIGNYAFSQCRGLQSITIPSSVTSIGVGAFSYCTNLQSITISGSVTSIGNYTFDGCTSLKNVAFNSIPQLGYGMFDYCYNLNTKTLALTDDSYVAADKGEFPTPTAQPTFTREMTTEWETIVVPFAITYKQSNADYKLYRLVGTSAAYISVFEYENEASIPAGTPMLIKAIGSRNASGKYEVTLTANGYDVSTTINNPAAISGLTLTGTYAKASVAAGAGYVFDGTQFVKTTEETPVAPFHAYLLGAIDDVDAITPQVHVHNIAKVDAVAATCTAAGNKAYWSCDRCGKLFSDEACTKETTLAAVTINAGHQFDANNKCTVCQLVIDPAQAVRLSSAASGGTHSDNCEEDYYNLFDEDTSTKWCLDETNPFVEFSTSELVYVTGYSFTTGNDTKSSPSRNPKTWKLFAKSSPSGAWTEIDSKSNDATLQAENKKEYQFALSKPTALRYQYFRLEFTHSGLMQLSEISLYGISERSLCAHSQLTHHDEVSATCTAAGNKAYWSCDRCGKLFSDEACTTETTLAALTINVGHQFDANNKCTVCQLIIDPSQAVCPSSTASSGTSGFEGENYDNLFDGKTSTKWCLKTDNPFVEFSTSELIYVTGYTFTTGDDTQRNSSRNPKTWKLFAKTSPSGAWEVIDSKSNDETLQAENEKEYQFALSKPTALCYQYFRLEFTHSGLMQLSEISVYGCNERSLCAHSKALTHHEGVPATCTTTGTREYWSCPDCNKMFSSATASAETMISDTTAPKLPHTVGADSKCSVCGATCMPYLAPTYNTPGDASSGIASWTTAYVATSDVTAFTSSSATLSAGWYLVNSEVTITSRITCNGAVHLILAPGSKLNAKAGIIVSGDGNSLAIYGQPDGAGELIATGGSESAGIGGGSYGCSGSNITINGGTVTATGGYNGAGIGGGYWASGSDITINGGTVTATGGEYAAGIGGGRGGAGSDITINGGTVTATGGYAGAGIGGGLDGSGSDIKVSTNLVTWNRSNNDAVIANDGSDLASALSGVKVLWIGPSHTHNYINKVSEAYMVTPATCTKLATYYRSCEVCGKSEEDPEHIFEGGELKPHDFTNRVEDNDCLATAGNCTLHATYYYCCAVCGNSENNAEHTFEGTTYTHTFVDGICSQCQKTGVAYLVPTYKTARDKTSGIASWTTDYVAEYTTITSESTTLSAGWYLVSNEVTINDRITCNGAVHLILATGSKLNAQAGITVSGKDNSLTIYGQPDGAGELVATGGDYDFAAGIGGGSYGSGSNITINGGTVTATGGDHAAGIGGGDRGSGSNITINGGTVTATGGEYAAGIGGGNYGSGSNITINGGTVTATGGYAGAGIGGGLDGSGSDIKVSTNLVTWNRSNDDAVIANDGSDLASALSGVKVLWIGPSHTHNYINKVSEAYMVTPATCTKLATYYRSCEVCGKSEEDPEHIFEGGELKPHDFTNQVEDNDCVATAGDCTTHATYYYCCAVCGLIENNAEHTFEGTTYTHTFVDGTCSKCQKTGVAYRMPTYKTARAKASGIASWTTAYVAEYTTITSESTTLSAGWYLVNSEVTINDRITCNGAVHLILATGSKLNAQAGIAVSGNDNSLTIYGQPDGPGELIATAKSSSSAAGIGNGYSDSGSNITINGGTVTATGDERAAGIGGGSSGSGSDITINGGTVTATGGDYAAGIGGGDYGSGSDITINGGTVTATGGYEAAGIGGGNNGSGSNITINGGTVTATGGYNGAGIGGGDEGSGSDIKVSTNLDVYNTDKGSVVVKNSGDDLASALSGVQNVLILLSGDLNADGQITISDLTLLIQLLNAGGTITNEAADVDKDGDVDINDVNALRNTLLGK